MNRATMTDNSWLASFVRGPSRARLWVFGTALAQAACSPLLKANDFTFADAAPSLANLETQPGGGAHADVNVAVRISAPEPDGLFGAAVALAGDTLAVSAPFANVAKGDGAVARAGAVYVYDLAAGTSRYEKFVLPNGDDGDGALPPNLVANNTQPAPFPWGAMSVALNDEVLVIGAAAEASARRDDMYDNSAPYAGAVYVYDRTKPGSPPQYIKAPNVGAGDVFGVSISLSGSLLAVGAPREGSGDPKNLNDDSAPVSGAVYVYTRDATGSFVNPVYVKAPQIAENAGFGFSVAVSEEYLVVGAPTESAGYVNGAMLTGNGRVYVFRRTADGWAPEQSLAARNAQASGFFGFSVSSMAAGSFVIGATGERDCETSGGAATTGRGDAYLVHQAGGEWVEDCMVPDSGIEQVIFGFSVAAGEGGFAVGAPYDSSALIGNPSDQSMGAAGAAYLFDSLEAGAKKQYVKAPRPRPSAFGYSLALGASRLVVGAAYEPDPAADSGAGPPDPTSVPRGAVYVFGLN